MDIQLGKRINELAVLCHKVLELVKNTKPFRLFSNELRSLADTLCYLAEVDSGAPEYSESGSQPFWRQFSSALNDCWETLRALAKILKDVKRLDNVARDMKLHEIGELRAKITPFSKTMNIALQIMTMFLPQA